ncbi:MAG: hypothetical protein ABL986_16725 [Vicinamibacterales bacterium]
MTPAPDVNVLVVFYSRHGKAEKLALRAGVGALQGRANIRLRRLADSASEETIAADALWTETRLRLHRDYVVPRPADPVWAEVIILVSTSTSSREAEAYLASLGADSAVAGTLIVPVLDAPDASTATRLRDAADAADLIVIDGEMTFQDIADAETRGRAATDVVRRHRRT